MFNCTCLARYTGVHCEHGVGDCALVDEPCNSQGICEDGVDSFRCVCLPGYTGEHCELLVNVTTAEEQVSSSDNTVVIVVVVVLVVMTLVASALAIILWKIRNRRAGGVGGSPKAATNTEQRAETTAVGTGPVPPAVNRTEHEYYSSDSYDYGDYV